MPAAIKRLYGHTVRSPPRFVSSITRNDPPPPPNRPFIDFSRLAQHKARFVSGWRRAHICPTDIKMARLHSRTDERISRSRYRNKAWRSGNNWHDTDRTGNNASNNSSIKNAVFWDVAPCGFIINRRFGGTYRLHQLWLPWCASYCVYIFIK
jgi:hypothetical protein